MARALYSHASIMLLDDVLAALDVHTSKWIIDKALSGDLVKGRTVLLVTHNIALAAPLAGHVVLLGRHGIVAATGSVSDVLKKDSDLRAQMQKEEEEKERVRKEEEEKEEVRGRQPGAAFWESSNREKKSWADQMEEDDGKSVASSISGWGKISNGPW